MTNNQKYFQENEFSIKDNPFKYYLSPILLKNNFKHGFLTKKGSKMNLSLLSKKLNINNKNCVLNQIHSNKIVLGSKTQVNNIVQADGMINDKTNQNLWLYTADCMPILFADKSKRHVAAVHCGRRGLEKKIINKLIKIFFSKGCSKNDLLVAIGPSISKKNYLIDNKTLQNFYKQTVHKHSKTNLEDSRILLNLKKDYLIPLNLKKYALTQILNEKIPISNIDISNLCTYESKNEFYSWRRSKTFLRQWSFISAL